VYPPDARAPNQESLLDGRRWEATRLLLRWSEFYSQSLSALKAAGWTKQLFCLRSFEHLSAAEVALRRRLERAKREGDLPKNADSAELAHYVMTVVRGMAVQSVGGASRDQLHRVAQIALRAWPKG